MRRWCDPGGGALRSCRHTQRAVGAWRAAREEPPRRCSRTLLRPVPLRPCGGSRASCCPVPSPCCCTCGRRNNPPPPRRTAAHSRVLWSHQPGSAASERRNFSSDEAPLYDLLVGVLSARHHHELRRAIRETWLGHLRTHPRFHHRVGVKFIVGERGCSVPEEDREDPYSCTLLNLTEPVAGQDEEVQLVKVSGPSVLTPSDVGAIALDFKVLHPVVITRLGVFPSGPWPELQSNVTVKLLQLDQEEPVVTARFSAPAPGTLVDGVWYKPVEQFILPKGFEGTLLWETLDSGGLSTVAPSSVLLSDGGGVLKISSVTEGALPHRSALGFPGLAGGVTFTIYDGDSLLALLQGRASRMQRQDAALRQEDAALQRESLTNGDMVFVDVVDTYRNVPSKLLQFYRWSVANAHFKLLLKTDDDCYIDVDSVLMKIDHKHLQRSNLWWGNFRQSWAVDRVGKWQELEYASPAYPAFACGSGYVVSRDLVQWLSSNAGKLKAYQGEDVSMGIWMAAVGPHKYQDPGWLCEKECYVDMLSSPQHSAEELHALWGRKEACGDPCGCPWGH
ncbi:UDP-GalNAc:beta-1,3-N-acetylgalactosaminyltransferase 2 isoform X2 [Takifugu flavidus]|uniref:UDP-GalNAc:beta-1, 3-N-acetylgalactosaminyltransferase 2 isoform X2 n=1 Tax=Takifugu flavidus TaxID=433684 RepID=UPI002544A727|nr:UDP-GalNAc:beta-1,3-N-acetylgalactosaminyltransferase 2 isoform X2 [Takifugu flavidus]